MNLLQLNMGNIQWCPKFNNLTTLTLSQWCLHPDFYPLIVFLQNSPSLENLTLKLRGVHGSLHMLIDPCTKVDACAIKVKLVFSHISGWPYTSEIHWGARRKVVQL